MPVAMKSYVQAGYAESAEYASVREVADALLGHLNSPAAQHCWSKPICRGSRAPSCRRPSRPSPPSKVSSMSPGACSTATRTEPYAPTTTDAWATRDPHGGRARVGDLARVAVSTGREVDHLCVGG